MLSMRFQRVGKKHQPSFRVVVSERRSKLGGPPLEYLGDYNPVTKQGKVNAERVLYWLGVGARSTVSIHNLLVRFGVIKAAKIPVSMKKSVVPTAKDVIKENVAVGGGGVSVPAPEASVGTEETRPTDETESVSEASDATR